jgi:predicted house-cleaning noncanonical NTP pyrophosphatase (MazG superfamily)
MKKLEKLVRDNIPDIAYSVNGERLPVRRYRRREMPVALLDKLVEESKEVRKTVRQAREKKKSARAAAEPKLADILEVLDELYAYLKISAVRVHREQMRKLREKGGFKKRLALNVL